MSDESHGWAVRLDRALAHGLLRLVLGINFTVRGAIHVPDVSAFAEYLLVTLTPAGGEPVLPGFVFLPAACLIIGVEVLLGLLILLGLFQRLAYAGALLLMAGITFGSVLADNTGAAFGQMVYAAVFAAMLATRSWDRYSLDGWRNRRNG